DGGRPRPSGGALAGRRGLAARGRGTGAGGGGTPATRPSAGPGVPPTGGMGRRVSFGERAEPPSVQPSARGMGVTKTSMEHLSMDTIRTLSMDAVQKAGAG